MSFSVGQQKGKFAKIVQKHFTRFYPNIIGTMASILLREIFVAALRFPFSGFGVASTVFCIFFGG